jgi:hypothetical protein
MEPRGGISVQCSRTPLANSFDPMDWVRASAVSILWNTAVMQRVIGDWTGVFDNGDALAGLVKRLDSEFLASVAWKNENGQVMVPAPLVTTSAPYGIWPRNEKDMLAAMHFLRAFGFEKARDPQEILRSVDQGIRMAASPELAALGFLYAGNVYFDLHSFALARRTYAWCESVAESFSEKVPGCLLFGAEAAFWESNFGAAARGFEKFIKHAADKEYVPWAYFRLALIAHQKGRRVEAEQRYAEIMRLYAAHATALESTVRNACLQIASNDFSYEGKRKIAAELQSAVSLSRQDLKRQAETCALRVLLENASDDARNRSNLPDDAKVQLALLEKYEKDFPGSPFLPLFEQRAKDIKHAFVVNLVDNNECEALQAKYEAQSKELDSLGSKAKVFLPALEWGDSERKIVIRCAALSKNLKLWAKLGKTNIGQDGGVVQKRLYDFYNTKQSSRAAVSLAKSIDSVADMEQWVKASREVTAAGRGYVRSSDFWLGLSLGALLRFDVSKPSSQTRELRQVLLRGIQKAPASLWGNDILCSMAMPELSRFSVAFWDDLAKSKKTAEWLELLKKGTSVPKDNKERCLMQVSKALWASTGTKPSQFRDSHIVLPYLEERGFAEVSDEWLAYAQRLEKREGPTKNVRLVYERLSKEGSSDTIRKMTQLWLENHPKEY